MRRSAVRAGMIALAAAVATPAAAQSREPPVSPVVVDVRGALPLFGETPTTASSLGVGPANLPTRGLGVSAGVHVYPLRRPGWAFGIGGEVLYARARRSTMLDPETPGPVIRRRLESLSGQISLNFGHRDGWSYLSGGIGPLAYETFHEGAAPDGVRAMTLNYGGGARWFTRPRLAATFDVRFYATRPADPTPGTGARIRQTVMVISVGISVR
jgi:hypothetical protein